MSSCSATGWPSRRPHRGGADRSRLRARPAAGRHQRRATSPTPAMLRGARRAALHRRGRALSRTTDRRRLTPEHCFKSAAEMRALFADLPEACDNTLVDRPALRLHAGAAQADPAALPKLQRGRDRGATALRAMAATGSRRGSTPPGRDGAPTRDRARYRERLDYELDMIVADGLRRLLPDRRRLHPMGEGATAFRSGPGAARAPARWSPGRSTITDLDPLRFGLLFERFLNPERVSMPDFDIDFCQDRRDEVIRYVQRRIRPRPRGADHHLRQAAGARRAARRRPRARHALRPGRPASASWCRTTRRNPVTLAAGDRRRAAAAGRCATTTRRSRG